MPVHMSFHPKVQGQYDKLLTISANNGHVEVVRVLLDEGADSPILFMMYMQIGIYYREDHENGHTE